MDCAIFQSPSSFPTRELLPFSHVWLDILSNYSGPFNMKMEPFESDVARLFRRNDKRVLSALFWIWISPAKKAHFCLFHQTSDVAAELGHTSPLPHKVKLQVCLWNPVSRRLGSILFEQLIGQGISVTPPSISTLFLWVALHSALISLFLSLSLFPLSGFNLAVFSSTWPSSLPSFRFNSGAGGAWRNLPPLSQLHAGSSIGG